MMMIKTTKAIHKICLIALALTATSCAKYLDIVPKEFHQESDLFSDIKQAEKEVAVLYNRLPWDHNASIGASGMTMAAGSDEAVHNWTSATAALLYLRGGWNPANNPLGNYNETYEQVRIAYRFLENVDNVPILDDRLKYSYQNEIIPRYKAEVKFLIAFYYFELFKRYGAIPIIDRFYTIVENDVLIQKDRRPTNEVVEFIVNLCDEAALGLPLNYENDPRELGRATKGAALALKAKTLLYAASPLFNGGELDGQSIAVNGEPIKNTLLGVKNTDGTPLFNQQYDREKWRIAADAAMDVINLGEYSLRSVQRELFYNRDFEEMIFWKQGGGASGWDVPLMPNGTDIGGSGALSLTQNTIDSYEMKNGLPIDDPNSGYDEDSWQTVSMPVYRNRTWQNVNVTIRGMYYNRDPRFYTDVYFNGMPLLHRNVITEFVQGSSPGTAHDGWAKSGQSTYTGYYSQKWVNPQQTPASQRTTSYRNFPFFRLADVYLWYAEAMNEYLDNPNTEVYTHINYVRNRVGMPGLPIAGRASDQTKVGMRARIRNERKIELAMEGHRFFDIRRWLIGHTPECTDLIGLDVNRSGDAFYVRKQVLGGKRVFLLQHYLMPIPAEETNKAPDVIKQNYGW